MVALLMKLFADKFPDRRSACGVLCGFLGIGLNILLFALKLFAGMISGSIAITADALNNLSDALSSVITILGFRLSAKRADPEHPFGHGRAEYISGLAVAMLIILMGFELAKSSVEKIFSPSEVSFDLLTAIILVVSILVKLYMMAYNRGWGKKISSATLSATATDSASDALSTLAVLVCMIVSHFTSLDLDGPCGLLVSLFIFKAGFGAAKDTIDPLLGKAPDKKFVDEIEAIVTSHDGIAAIHDLIVHDYGPGRRIISLHAEIPSDADILAAHDLIDNVENELEEKLNCTAVIHMDPIDVNDPETLELRRDIDAIAKGIDPDIRIHDFRVVKGDTHTNCIFDAVIPNSIQSDAEAAKLISDAVKKKHPNHNCVIKTDRNYT